MHKADREIVLEAMKQNVNSLQYAVPELKADREFMLGAAKQNGYALTYAVNCFIISTYVWEWSLRAWSSQPLRSFSFSTIFAMSTELYIPFITIFVHKLLTRGCAVPNATP